MKLKDIKIMFVGLSLFIGTILSWNDIAYAQELIIHGAEIGVGKFHREDNKRHPYAAQNIWSPFILPAEASSSQTPIVKENSDGSVTIFFSHLKELLQAASQFAAKNNKKIKVLNINAHGLPGATWFPKDEKTKNSLECYDWKNSAEAEDIDNYTQYYSPVSKNEVLQIRQLSSSSSGHYPCVTGLKEWREVLTLVSDFKSALSSDFQLHFFSCVVGLGARGQEFTQGLASLLLNTQQGRIETSLKFGLGDWSMPAGMGFWDYETDQQLSRDNKIYPQNKKDSEIQQNGTIRVATLNNQKQVQTGYIENIDYMFADVDNREPKWSLQSPDVFIFQKAPAQIRVPGTKIYLKESQ